MPVVLALDQGTTSTRTIVFDEDGQPLASAQRELAQHYPRPGWVEHDPVEIADAQRATMHEALAAAGTSAHFLGASDGVPGLGQGAVLREVFGLKGHGTGPLARDATHYRQLRQ